MFGLCIFDRTCHFIEWRSQLVHYSVNFPSPDTCVCLSVSRGVVKASSALMPSTATSTTPHVPGTVVTTSPENWWRQTDGASLPTAMASTKMGALPPSLAYRTRNIASGGQCHVSRNGVAPSENADTRLSKPFLDDDTYASVAESR